MFLLAKGFKGRKEGSVMGSYRDEMHRETDPLQDAGDHRPRYADEDDEG
jgi:23S rRNA (uridine2552-2'-O)-methyltransferase